MPRLTEQTQRERRDQIASAALRCFARQGLSGTSMADIIVESGLSAGSIYSHFSGKGDLVRHVASQKLDVGTGPVLAAAAEQNLAPADVFAIVFDAIRPELSANARLLMQLWADVPRDPELADFAAGNVARLRGVFTEVLLPWAGGRDGAGAQQLASQRADAVMCLIQGCVARFSLAPETDVDALRASMLAVLM